MSAALSDADLLSHLSQGNAQALSELARRHVEWLVNIAAPIVASRDSAEDVVQDVFVHLWERRSTLKASHDNVRALLYRAVKNRAMDMARRERSLQRRAIVASDLIAGVDSEDADGIQGGGAGENDAYDIVDDILDRAIAQLQPRTREIFILRAQHGMPIPDIAAALGVTVGTVYTQLYRATKLLAQNTELRRYYKTQLPGSGKDIP